ncbi:HD family phosphohydrolase [Clostridium hydrogeniformans]|uniref:HD family phosphohydrolase n=1 Tax=Clostridium hydrogeniformans TaxID=349933 RepID=UPI0009FF7ED4|nr:HD family phosphohydrolase [Clostridium hydrogeniformans]
MVSYVLIMTSLVTKKYSLSPGEIAKVNIKASKEVIDNRATQDKIKQAEKEVTNQYTQKPEVKKSAMDNLRDFFSKLISTKELQKEEAEKVAALRGINDIYINDEEIVALLKLSLEDIKKLENIVLDIGNQVYDGTITEGNKEDLKKAQDFVSNKLSTSKYSKGIREIVFNIINYQLKPNFFFDKEKTEELRKQAVKNVQPVMIQKNQIIVKEGEPVTEAQIDILKDLGLLNDSGLDFYIYIGLGVFIALIQFIQWYYLYKYFNDTFNDTSKLILISIVNLASLALARTLSIISPYLIPIACAPMLLTLLLNYKVSLTLSVLNSILISSVVDFNVEITLIAILNGVLGAILIKKMQQRNDILYSSLYIAVVNMILTFTMGILLSNNVLEVVKKSGFTGIASLISAVLTIGFLPFFESTFDIVTVVKLLELSNPNNPLLKKILMETPGTYHHSILVANLAEVAAEQVGGNPVLVRIAAYYHDVGKTKRPYFFKENQINRENPHDKITPNLSTLIITSHVKDGLEMAKEHNLPKVIQDIIVQHHGTTLVKYFYYMAKNNSENPEEIKEADFRYPGPIPQTKEAGIVMLADGVEAAVRSIKDPTQGKIEEMVNNIIKDKLNDGQLDHCDLTLKDLDKIRKAFLNTLNGIYHRRIEYPSESKKQNKGE